MYDRYMYGLVNSRRLVIVVYTVIACNTQVEEKVSKMQRRYFLQEQLKIIKRELGLEVKHSIPCMPHKVHVDLLIVVSTSPSFKRAGGHYSLVIWPFSFNNVSRAPQGGVACALRRSKIITNLMLVSIC